jgi:hypothetical protein
MTTDGAFGGVAVPENAPLQQPDAHSPKVIGANRSDRDRRGGPNALRPLHGEKSRGPVGNTERVVSGEPGIFQTGQSFGALQCLLKKDRILRRVAIGGHRPFDRGDY